MEAGEEKDEAIIVVANLMKRFYLQWNQKNLSDEVIEKDFNALCEGLLPFPGIDKLKAHSDLKQPEHRHRRKSHHGGKNHHRGRKKY